ncbi:hypothetical protein EFA46_000840 [Halarchaeum sp. CBA1220]|uniref:hypothetical protein n=1 Tax=Halarchaeum sp. CBA1220 TaxID=1853682 RepID=UPI000F3A93BF|nr:hypothetical protein [Halarchaeum sp. CBA1220]QLC32813.1 hypothetical protein EFA46_000840 [Halarchaeum sp. CBA1220]
MTPEIALWGVAVVVLVALCVAFAYPLLAYSHNVLYREGVLLFTVALACLSAGALLELLVAVGVLDVVLRVLAYVFYAASGAVSVAATWRFAREFIDLGGDAHVDVESDEYVGGFENER